MTRFCLACGAALLWAGIVHAQDAKTFTLNVTQQDLQIMSAALDELPRKISEPVVEKLQKQLIPQMQPKADVPAAKE
jgi:hypothetical protein